MLIVKKEHSEVSHGGQSIQSLSANVDGENLYSADSFTPSSFSNPNKNQSYNENRASVKPDKFATSSKVKTCQPSSTDQQQTYDRIAIKAKTNTVAVSPESQIYLKSYHKARNEFLNHIWPLQTLKQKSTSAKGQIASCKKRAMNNSSWGSCILFEQGTNYSAGEKDYSTSNDFENQISFSEESDKIPATSNKYGKETSYNYRLDQNPVTTNNNELEVTKVMKPFQSGRDKNQSATSSRKQGLMDLVPYQIYSISIKKARSYLRDWSSSFVPILFLLASIWCGAEVSHLTIKDTSTVNKPMIITLKDYERLHAVTGVGAHGLEAEKVMSYYTKYVESYDRQVDQVILYYI